MSSDNTFLYGKGANVHEKVSSFESRDSRIPRIHTMHVRFHPPYFPIYKTILHRRNRKCVGEER